MEALVLFPSVRFRLKHF